MNINILKRELRTRRLHFVVWSLSVVIFVVVSFQKFSTLTTDGPEIAEKLIGQLPTTIQALFGMTGLDITTINGYYGISFLFFALMLAVHAGLLGVQLLSEEEDDKTSEFLYVKPISRSRVINQKLIAGLVVLTGIWAVTAISIWLSVAFYDDTKGFETVFWVGSLALAITQLVFFCTGMAMSAIARSAGTPAKAITALIFAQYFISVIANLLPSQSWLRHFSILSYFDGKHIVNDESLATAYVVVCTVVIISSISAVYYFYNRRDLRV